MLLAIAITVLVLFLVGTALYLQLRIIDGARSEVEQAQVARALLRHIGDDLRNVIKYDPQQVSLPSSAGATAGAAAQALGSAAGSGAAGSATGGASSGAGSSGSGGATSGGVSGGSGAGGSSGSGGATSGMGSAGGTSGAGTSGSTAPSTGTGSDSGSSSSSSSLEPDAVPGLRGDAEHLQIDISRLPRRDQLLAAEAGAAARASDSKTVAYFVDDPTSTQDTRTGLKRFEIARVDAQVAVRQGTQQELIASSATLLAAEVVRASFQYSDGTQWYTDWPPDGPATTTEDAAQLPLAVHVVLYLKPPGFDEQYGGQSWKDINMSGFPQRRMIVPLPAADPPGDSSSTGSSSSSSNSSNSNQNPSSGNNNSSSGSGTGASSSGGGSSGGTFGSGSKAGSSTSGASSGSGQRSSNLGGSSTGTGGTGGASGASGSASKGGK